MHSRRGAVRHHQPDGELLQAHQRAADAVGRDLVAQHRDLCRQQPHPHDPHPRCRPLRAAPRRRRRQPLPAAGGASSPPGSTASGTSAIPASASTSTCTPRATRRRAPRSCRSICSMRCARWRNRRCCKAAFGEDVVASYLKLKHAEWNAYAAPPHRLGAPDHARLLSRPGARCRDPASRASRSGSDPGECAGMTRVPPCTTHSRDRPGAAGKRLAPMARCRAEPPTTW